MLGHFNGRLAHTFNEDSFHGNANILLRVLTNDNLRIKYLKSISKGPFGQRYSTVIIAFSMREFPICDVAGREFGKSLFLQKGIPISKTFILEIIFLDTYCMQ